MFNAANVLLGTEKYQPLINELSSLVDKYLKSITRRHAMHKEKHEDLDPGFDEIQDQP